VTGRRAVERRRGRGYERPVRNGALAAVAWLAAACGRPQLTRAPAAELDARLGEAVAARDAPAIAAAVVGRDGAPRASARGLRDLALGAPATPDTVFAWFSVTKIVTATAVMQLVDAGRVELDAPVRAYVPSFRVEGPGADGVTVRHLLSHTSGLQNPIPVGWIHAADEQAPDLDAMTARLLASHPRLRFRPGARFAYSNLGYLVLGQLVERVSGERYPDYVRRHLLEPLGCARAGFAPPEGDGDVATGYTRRWSAMGLAGRFLVDARFLGETTAGFVALRPFRVDGAPYGGLFGTAGDLARLAAAHLRGGELDGRRILSEASALAMRTPQRDARGRALPIGLGWRLGELDGEPYAFHQGGGAGFKSEVRLYPRLGQAVAVVATETSFDTGPIARLVLVPFPP
jgi:CubicO group peptidase (beta-lactamase class C family)